MPLTLNHQTNLFATVSINSTARERKEIFGIINDNPGVFDHAYQLPAAQTDQVPDGSSSTGYGQFPPSQSALPDQAQEASQLSQQPADGGKSGLD